MKATDIQIGADYAVGGPSYTRRGTVVKIEKRHDGLRVVVRYVGNPYDPAGWTDRVPPQSVRRPWAEEQEARDLKAEAQARQEEKRADIRAEMEGAIATIERVLGVKLIISSVHVSALTEHSYIKITGTQLHRLADAIADTGEETP